MVDAEGSCGLIADTQKISGVERVFSECKRRGVTLFLENGRIAYKPKARMTKGLLYNIKQSKDEIVLVLGRQPGAVQEDMFSRLTEEVTGQPVLHADLTSDEDELQELLIAISEAGLTLRVPTGDGIKLYVSPPDKVTLELAQKIRKHKDRIISVMQFDEYRRTEEIQNTGQVLDLWREWEAQKAS